MKKNAFYAQSGGVTAVINATAAGVIEGTLANKNKINKLYIGKNGILGALNDSILDANSLSHEAILKLKQTPGGAFGSCRYKLKSYASSEQDYEKILNFFKKYDIGYFFYNGGGDSQDTVQKIAAFTKERNFPVQCIGIPKTIDNDLPVTDASPGFGSVAKYVAIATMEAGLDIASMAKTSTKVFILEVMGRHAGWIAAAAGLAANDANMPPHIILFPERIFEKDKFLQQVQMTVERCGYCVIVASEGIKDSSKRFVAEQNMQDAFGHAQLGGVASSLATMIKDTLKYKYHYAIADYLQRAARHISSGFDVEFAYQVGQKAVDLAMMGKNCVMPIMVRTSNAPFKWHLEDINVDAIANQEKVLPENFITENGYGITQAARTYLLPLIQGEAYPSYNNGLPDYFKNFDNES